MYGKLFASIYDGSMYGHWQALVTFQQMICLANRDGVVDMTPAALSARTSIPLDIIQTGIAHLQLPDPESRSPECDGRRIETIDSHRSWGWRIVNYDHYRKLASMEDKLLADRERIAKKREDEKAAPVADVATCRNLSQPVANVAHAEVEVEVEVNRKKKLLSDSSKSDAMKLLEYLNSLTGHKYRPVKVNLAPLMARLATSTPDDIRSVIDAKVDEWQSDPKMRKYLRPDTLFNASKFEQYLGQIGSSKVDDDFHPYPVEPGVAPEPHDPYAGLRFLEAGDWCEHGWGITSEIRRTQGYGGDEHRVCPDCYPDGSVKCDCQTCSPPVLP